MIPKQDKVHQLSIIVPVYNEAEIISSVVNSWIRCMDALEIDYEMLVYDDGSQDSTAVILQSLAKKHQYLKISTNDNLGHGPTILQGYREARGEWVLQIDSDNEISPDHFNELWSRREQHDFLLGSRATRQSSFTRKLVTLGARLTIWSLFGKDIRDVNSPYRLMRRSWLSNIVQDLPNNTFAPNLIITGLAIRHRLRVIELPFPHENSMVVRAWRFSRLSRGALIAFIQTVHAAIRNRKSIH